MTRKGLGRKLFRSFFACSADIPVENPEQWRYNTKGQRVETLIGMISLCDILNNGVITQKGTALKR